VITQVRSVSTIVRHPVVHLLGQTSYLAGAPAALRVIVTDGTLNHSPITTRTVHIELLAHDAEPLALFTGKLDRRGSTNAEFRFPANLSGDASIRITAETPLGTTDAIQSIHLEDKVSILLTTEKPIATFQDNLSYKGKQRSTATVRPACQQFRPRRTPLPRQW
jgi:hypothetical protein